MVAAGSVHISARLISGSRTADFVCDVAAGHGRQEISMNNGERATMLQVDDMAYLRGNKAAMVGYFQIPGKLSGRWLSVASSDPGYPTLTEDLNLQSQSDEIKLGAPLTLTGRTTVDGQAVEGVHGKVPAGAGAPAGATATLYVAVAGRHLPVELSTGNATNQIVSAYSRWGEQVRLTAPSGATVITSSSS
jgi:hypothetical protein